VLCLSVYALGGSLLFAKLFQQAFFSAVAVQLIHPPLSAMSEEYPEASAEQKLNIATYFLQSSPVGEIDEVLAGECRQLQSHDDAARDRNSTERMKLTQH
jgi:hypothetical protein